ARLGACAQRIQERDQKARAGRADGMAEGDGAAVDVELRVGYVQLAANAFDAAERLVHLEEIDVGDLPPGLREAALYRAFRGGEEPLGLMGELTLRDDAR